MQFEVMLSKRQSTYFKPRDWNYFKKCAFLWLESGKGKKPILCQKEGESL